MLDAADIDDIRRRLPGLGADPDLLKALTAHGTPVRLEPGQFVLMEGQSCAGLAVLLSGVVRVYKAGETGREITLYRIEAGESCVLTASCILSGGAFPAQARVEEAGRAVAVPAETVRSWLHRHPAWQAFLFGQLSARLAGVIATVEEVTFRRMDARLADHLLEVATDGRVRATHQALAAELGTSREVVSRLLKDFERGGLVQPSRGAVALVDVDGLRALGSRVT